MTGSILGHPSQLGHHVHSHCDFRPCQEKSSGPFWRRETCLLPVRMIPTRDADGTVFPWQGGVLDSVSIETFGIIVVVVLSLIVLLDSELTWLAQILRWLRFRELRRERAGRPRGARRSDPVGHTGNHQQDSDIDCPPRKAPAEPEP